jgi:hypothetical protein
VATKKQQRRKYQRAVGRGRLHDGYVPRESEDPEEERRPSTKPVMLGAREVQPPSYLRAAKRALVMAGIVFVALMLLPLGGDDISPATAALQAAVFFAWLTPFGYFMDAFLYRRAVKRQQRQE